MKNEQDELQEDNKDRKRPVPIEEANIRKIIHGVQKSNNKKTKLFEPVNNQGVVHKQQESKLSSEALNCSVFRYDFHVTAQQAFTKHDTSPHLLSPRPSIFSTSGLRTSSNPYLKCNNVKKLTTTNENLVYSHPRPSNSGYSQPSASITFQEYKREQEQERKVFKTIILLLLFLIF